MITLYHSALENCTQEESRFTASFNSAELQLNIIHTTKLSYPPLSFSFSYLPSQTPSLIPARASHGLSPNDATAADPRERFSSLHSSLHCFSPELLHHGANLTFAPASNRHAPTQAFVLANIRAVTSRGKRKSRKKQFTQMEQLFCM